MAKFVWQDGTLVSKAKVEVGGVIYEVDPEEYSGTTPLSATNLNAMVDQTYEDLQDYSDEKSLEVYSTTETVCGAWIDNKPIYKRTFTGNSGTARTNAQVTIAENQTIDTLVSAKGAYQNKTASSKSYQILGNDTSALVYDTAGSSANKIIFFINNSSSATFDYWITVYYTKTTD